jgi:hypothetical protein
MPILSSSSLSGAVGSTACWWQWNWTSARPPTGRRGRSRPERKAGERDGARGQGDGARISRKQARQLHPEHRQARGLEHDHRRAGERRIADRVENAAR